MGYLYSRSLLFTLLIIYAIYVPLNNTGHATLFTWIGEKYLQEDLAKMGVMIRHYDKKELKGYIRISVGKPEHTDALMEGFKALKLWEFAMIYFDGSSEELIEYVSTHY